MIELSKHAMRSILTSVLILLAVTLTGCYDAKEIDEMAYAVAVGIDSGTTNKLRVTIMFAVPETGNSSQGSSKQTGVGNGGRNADESGKTSTVVTVEGPAIYTSINLFNSFMGKIVNFSHANLLVISEDVAKSGDMGRYLHGIVRGKEFRPTTNIIMVRGSAEEFLKSIESKLHSNESRLIDMIFNKTRFNLLSVNSTIHSFYTQLESTSTQAVITLASVNRLIGSENFSICSSTFTEKGRDTPFEGDFYAGDLPRSGGPTIEVQGLAVFKGDHMVGMLDGEESCYHQMATGKYNYMNWTIPDPLAKDEYIVLNIRQNRYPYIKVDYKDDTPEITLGLFLEADFVTIQSGINYEDINNVEIVEEAAKTFLTNGMTDYLYKTSKVYKSDINGFGGYAKKMFLYWQDWIDSDWLDKYEHSTFKTVISFSIRRPDLLVKSVEGKG